MEHPQSLHKAAWSPASVFAAFGAMALSIRLVQGWIFWGGASRRMFYDFGAPHGHDYAMKLDPGVSGYVASKLVHAMPGSLFPHLIENIVQNPGLLHGMVWFWTLVELVVGVGLIVGLATRLLSLVSIGLNISLMVIFGWMGSTCVDEWTMAAAGFAMGATLVLTGGGHWSVDHRILSHRPRLAETRWFPLLFSGPLSVDSARRWGIGLGALSIAFTVLFYQFLHGAVISPLHARVNFHKYGLAISGVRIQPAGGVRFRAYVDAGPDTGKLYITDAALIDPSGRTVADWPGKELSALPKSAFDNTFHQAWASRFAVTGYGFGAITGAKATITLPARSAIPHSGFYTLRLTDIDGRHFDAKGER